MSTAAEQKKAASSASAIDSDSPAAVEANVSAQEVDVPAVPAVEVVKASFNLPKRELDALKRIAAIRGVSATQALRQAIAILAFLVDLPRGSRFYVREPSGDQREVVFHNF
jgi:hypothetical protein